MIDFSVVILSFNSERYIDVCLSSLVDSFQALEKSYEIFVIDNGSQDKSKELINQVKESRKANIELIEFEHNTGTTFSRNQGLKKSTGKQIIILDSDAYVNAKAIDFLSKELSEKSKCGLICPKLVYPDGRFQLSTDVFPTLVRKFQRFFFLKKMEADITDIPTSPQTVDYAISAFWMFSREVLDKVGPLDERIFYSPEDVDYCIRVWKAGFRIIYDPRVSVVHDAQEISRGKGFKVNFFTLSHIKGLFYLFLKHRYFFSGRKFTLGVLSER